MNFQSCWGSRLLRKLRTSKRFQPLLLKEEKTFPAPLADNRVVAPGA
jgi:hypothetical protein